MRRTAAFFTATTLTLGLTAAGFAGVAAAGETLTKKEFLAEGNAICKVASQGINDVFEQTFAGLDENSEPPPEVLQAALDGVLPIFRGAISDIDTLEGPASVEKKVDKVLAQYEAVLVGFEADPQSAFSEGPDPFTKADKAARKVGLKKCQQGD
jgi:hypothetical protein